jgi:hypothetical protein
LDLGEAQQVFFFAAVTSPARRISAPSSIVADVAVQLAQICCDGEPAVAASACPPPRHREQTRAGRILIAS